MPRSIACNTGTFFQFFTSAHKLGEYNEGGAAHFVLTSHFVY